GAEPSCCRIRRAAVEQLGGHIATKRSRPLPGSPVLLSSESIIVPTERRKGSTSSTTSGSILLVGIFRSCSRRACRRFHPFYSNQSSSCSRFAFWPGQTRLACRLRDK